MRYNTWGYGEARRCSLALALPPCNPCKQFAISCRPTSTPLAATLPACAAVLSVQPMCRCPAIPCNSVSHHLKSSSLCACGDRSGAAAPATTTRSAHGTSLTAASPPACHLCADHSAFSTSFSWTFERDASGMPIYPTPEDCCRWCRSSWDCVYWEHRTFTGVSRGAVPTASRVVYCSESAGTCQGC